MEPRGGGAAGARGHSDGAAALGGQTPDDKDNHHDHDHTMPTPPTPQMSCYEQRQGLTLVHVSAQLERFTWDRGCA